MTAPRMTDARLDRVREMVTEGVLDDHVGTLAELLADRDHWEAEARKHECNVKLWRGEYEARTAEWKHALGERDDANARALRYRSRCPVTAEDVEAAGVTWEKIDAWVLAQPDGTDEPLADGRALSSWRKNRDNPDGATWRYGLSFLIHRGTTRANAVSSVARLLSRPAFDILDEMAAMAEEPSP